MIRPAAAADGPAIAAVQRRTWHATYRGILPDEVLDGFDVAAAGRSWGRTAEAPRPGAAVFVAEDGRAVIGFAAVAAVDGEAGVGEVRRSTWSRSGRAPDSDAACSRRRSRVSRAGFGDVLWVAEANDGARGFYESLGWTHDGAARLWRGAAVVRYRRAL